MAKVSAIQNNFNGGEISPLLFGRPDVDKYKTGLQTCLNFVPLIQGPIERRPGMGFVKEVKTSANLTRIIRFEFSTTQAYIIELGNLYARFYKDNGAILDGAKTISAATKANPCVVTATSHGYSNGDEIFIDAVVGMTELNGKYYKIKNKATNTFELTDIDDVNTNSSSFTTYGSGGTASKTIELVTTYTTANLFELKFTQSADVLYITHPSYTPRKISRTSDTDWSITDITFTDGPYLNSNVETTTLGLSATSGSVTVTASAVTGINDGSGFLATDVGRSIRWKDAAGNFTFLGITAVADTTHVTATIDGPNASATTATVDWRLGVWSNTTGFPSAVTFHQDRLVFGGGVDFPQRVDMSRTGDFENFTPTEPDGTVVDDNAVTVTLAADNVNAIRWLADDEKGLLVGTVGGEWTVRPSDAGGVTTPSNVQGKRSSAYGSANVQPVRVGRAMLFLQRAQRKLRELAFAFEDDGFRAPDMTLIAEHVTRTGVTEIAYQSEPQSIVWCALNDGTLVGLTYERDQKIIGWHRHVVGGYSDSGGTIQAKVESVAVIPNPEGVADELYVVVNRYINGATRRYIEYLNSFWDATNDPEDSFFVDSGLTLDNPTTITAITKAKPCVVTAGSHGLSNGDTVRITEVGGMTEVNKGVYRIASKAANTMELFNTAEKKVTISAATAANPVVITAVGHGLSNADEVAIFDVVGMTELNGLGFTVAGVTANTFQLSGINGSGYTTYVSGGDIHSAIDSSAFTTYLANGKVRQRVTTLSGLDHLEGQTVSILSEGATVPDKTVSSGAITFSRPTTKAHVGLAYTSDAETLRSDAGAKDGTAQGKLIRVHRVIVRFFQSLGGKIGSTNTSLDSFHFREGGDAMDTAIPLFTGDVEIEWDGGYSSDEHIFIRQDQPLPMTLEALMPQMSTQDR